MAELANLINASFLQPDFGQVTEEYTEETVDKEGHHQSKHVEKGDGFEMITFTSDTPMTDVDIAQLLNDAMAQIGIPGMPTLMMGSDQRPASH